MDTKLTASVSFSLLFLSAVVFAQTAAKSCSSTIYIGILDDAREQMRNWEPGVASQRLIRPAFEKNCTGWHDVTTGAIPADMVWTVAFDGRNLGEVRGHRQSTDNDLKKWCIDSLTFVQCIDTPFSSIPFVGTPSQQFAGLMADGPGKARRPLVLLSKPYVSDPDGWKRIPKPPDEIATLIHAAFRRDFPHVNRCKEEQVLQHNWKFPDSSLSLPVAYASNKNSFLVEASLNAGDCGYVDDPNDPLSDPWFYVSADGNVRRIGSFMSLLDAGDYDNDGRSELIFFLSQPEDTDGFVLFDADLHKQGSLLWSYH
jgi:hypothetical protein